MTTTTEIKTIFPNLTKAVNDHHNTEAQKFSANLDRLTCAEALASWWYCDRMTDAAYKLVKESDPAALLPETAKKKMISRFTRENEKSRAKYLAKLEAAENAPDLEFASVNIEWKRSATWGANPSVEIRAERTRTTGTASGCGYDKASAATAGAANANPEIMRILYKHAEKGEEFPYSVYTYAGLPYFDGGCGMNCFESVFDVCGYKFRQTAYGKMFDAYILEVVK